MLNRDVGMLMEKYVWGKVYWGEKGSELSISGSFNWLGLLVYFVY